jgi:hypothetical protein
MRHGAALVLALALTGCGGPLVSPLPIEAPVALPSPSLSRSPSLPRSAAPTTPPPSTPRRPTSPAPTRRSSSPSSRPTPSLPAACYGPVRVEMSPHEPMASATSLCIAAGGVLRISGTGPGTVEIDREDLADQHYEAGVVDVRFLRPGTVVVTVALDEDSTETITAVVR